MANWIEVRIRYDKMMENGLVKKVVEPYLVDALSCTEAEARTIEEVTPFISGEFRVSSVITTKISEIFFDSVGDRFYKVKVNFITIDEKTAAEKRTATYILVQANSFKDALANFEKGMKGTLADYEIEAINETKIVEVYRADLSGGVNTSVSEEDIKERIANNPDAGKHLKAARKAAKEFVKTVQSDPNIKGVDITATDANGHEYAHAHIDKPNAAQPEDNG